MKSRMIDLTETWDDCQATEGVLFLLWGIGIKSANKKHDDIADMIDEDFCSECHCIKDDCFCHSEGRYVREYDDGASLED